MGVEDGEGTAATPPPFFGRIRSRGLTEYGNPTTSHPARGRGGFAIAYREAGKSTPLAFREITAEMGPRLEMEGGEGGGRVAHRRDRGTHVYPASFPRVTHKGLRLLEFTRCLDHRDAAHELPNLPLEDALQLVHLYAERGSPKYEKAAIRWLERYLTEGAPTLQHVAEITAGLAKREPNA